MAQTLRTTAYLCFALAAIQLFWVMPEIPGLLCRITLKLLATAAFAIAFSELLKEPENDLRKAGLALMALASVGSFGAAVAEVAASTLLGLSLAGGAFLWASLRNPQSLSGLMYVGGLAWGGVAVELLRRPVPLPESCHSTVVLAGVLGTLAWCVRAAHPALVWVPAGLAVGKLGLTLAQWQPGLLPLALGVLLMLTPQRKRVPLLAGMGACALLAPQNAVLTCLGLSFLCLGLKLRWDSFLLLLPAVLFTGQWPLMMGIAGALAVQLYAWRKNEDSFTALALAELVHLGLWAASTAPTWGLSTLGLVAVVAFVEERRLRSLMPLAMLTLWSVWIVGDPLGSWLWGLVAMALSAGLIMACADVDPGWAFLLAATFLLAKSFLWLAPLGLLWFCLSDSSKRMPPSSVLVLVSCWGLLAAHQLAPLALLAGCLAATYVMESEFQNRVVLGFVTLALLLKGFVLLGSGAVSTAMTATLGLFLLARGNAEIQNGGRLLLLLGFVKAIVVDTNFNLKGGAWDIALWGVLGWKDVLFMVLTLVALGGAAYLTRNHPRERNLYLLASQIALAFQITTGLYSVYGVLDQFQVILSIFWSLTSFFFIATGVFKEVKVFRLFGLVLLSASALKICAVDLWVLGAYSKVGTLLILGALLMVVSFLYQSHRERLSATRLVPA